MIAPSAGSAGDGVAHPGRAETAAVAGDLEEVQRAAGADGLRGDPTGPGRGRGRASA